MMQLWTYHRDSFSIIDDSVDPARSKFARDFPAQYAKLWSEIGTQQIIWCVTNPDDWPMKAGYDEWELDVPPEAFLRVVDDVVWNRILGRTAFPKRLYDQLEDEARRDSRDDDVHEIVMSRIDSLRHPPGDLWDHVFIRDPLDCRATVLLKGPVSEGWVVGHPHRSSRPIAS